jgi:hypothetical protein
MKHRQMVNLMGTHELQRLGDAGAVIDRGEGRAHQLCEYRGM